MDRDLEQGNSSQVWQPKTGFAAFSRFLASDKDRFLMVFRRFDGLAVQNLVYLQSELDYLQCELARMDIDDEYNTYPGPDDMTQRQCLVEWGALKRQSVRLELIQNIRTTMKDYREALLQESAICKLDIPTQHTHDALLYAIEGNQSRHGHSTGYFKAPNRAKALYQDREDLASLRSPTFEDGITAFVDKHCSYLFKTSGEDYGIYRYSHDKMLRAVNLASALFAMLTIILPIWGLYAVGKYVAPPYAPWIQLAIMTTCTLAFVVILGLLMNVKRAELFGAAATYPAVLVVFLSGL